MKRSYISREVILFDNVSFFWDLKYLNTFFIISGLNSFSEDMKRTDDTNRITKDNKWKE